MNDILNKTIVPVLNRNWRAIHMRTPQEAFCMMATNVNAFRKFRNGCPGGTKENLFKQWTSAKRSALKEMLCGRFILYGEWLCAKHSIHYRKLPHYFFGKEVKERRMTGLVTSVHLG
jgi:hypothetical protein